MNKRTKIGLALCVTGLTLAQSGFTASLDKVAVASQCEVLAQQVHGLLKDHEQDPCHFAVESSSRLIKWAGIFIRGGNIVQGARHLRIVGAALDEIVKEEAKCSYFSQQIKPSLDTVKELQSALAH